MKKNVSYIRDYCGKVFDNETDCVSHEWEHQCESMKDYLRFANSKGEIIELAELNPAISAWRSPYDDVMYVKCLTREAYDFFLELDYEYSGSYNDYDDFYKDDVLYYEDCYWRSTRCVLEEAQYAFDLRMGIFQ